MSDSKERRRRCWACRKPIEPDASICVSCHNWQNWRRWLSLSTVNFSLLIALISVIGAVAPAVRESILALQAGLDVQFAGLDIVREELSILALNTSDVPVALAEQMYCSGDHVVGLPDASPDEWRAGLSEMAARSVRPLSYEAGNSVWLHEPQVSGSGAADRAVAPGGFKVIVYRFDRSYVGAMIDLGLFRESVRSGSERFVICDVGAFGGNPIIFSIGFEAADYLAGSMQTEINKFDYFFRMGTPQASPAPPRLR